MPTPYGLVRAEVPAWHLGIEPFGAATVVLLQQWIVLQRRLKGSLQGNHDAVLVGSLVDRLSQKVGSDSYTHTTDGHRLHPVAAAPVIAGDGALTMAPTAKP